MSYEPIVYCRQCNEPLDVYEPFENRFCCVECEDYFYNGGDGKLSQADYNKRVINLITGPFK